LLHKKQKYKSASELLHLNKQSEGSTAYPTQELWMAGGQCGFEQFDRKSVVTLLRNRVREVYE
jgi:hypothetical protein